MFSKSKNGLIVESSGVRKWYRNNLLHREDGPAIEYPNGEKKWYKRGLLHREDGPAAEFADGERSWYLHDVWLTELEHFQESPYFQNMPEEERVYHRLLIDNSN